MINSRSDQNDPRAARTGTEEAGRTAAAAPGASLPDDDLDPVVLIGKERDDLKDQLLRSRAEFANYQKRVKQQAEVEKLYAIGDLARDLLEVIDNLERAAEALRASNAEGVSSGLEMVHKQLLSTLAKYGVEPIEALEQPFDPNFHDAMLQQPSADHPEGTVVAELGRGYKIHDRVLRPSKVAVSVKP